MYSAYFGLSEAPFSIAPDPAYLFMSDRHREALAHLSYGLGDNGGFVLLTGEVGTGKTTISRSVIEKLPEHTQAAIILNPTLSCDELLATICDSLKIRYKKTGATLKYLTDKIQEKLIKNHQDNINTLLIIDEAQHLQPQVLEQLRLLTNLETNTKKLLQVILIGQPELQQLLQRRDLRQLAQRITARYHLLPLTLAELSQYIQHRLSVAQCGRSLFNKAAIKELHQASKGIPRVVNLLCDRALILAYGQNVTVVNRKLVQKAAVEALGEDAKSTSTWRSPIFVGAFTAVIVTLGIAGGVWFGFNVQPSLAPPSEVAIAAVKAEQAEAISKAAPLSQPTKTVVAAKPDEINQQLVTSTADAEKMADDAQNDFNKTAKQNVVQQPRILGYQPERIKPALNDKGFELVATEEVSDDLLARFQAAVNETKHSQELVGDDNASSTFAYSPDDEIKAIHQMPVQIQNNLPDLRFEMHMFATEGQGWVRVNGTDRKEGETIAQGVVLAQILPQQVVLEFQNERFTMPALSSW